jgi:predicted nucleic acid-binding protein
MSRGFSTLEAVPAGASVFIDANIFIYHFLGVSRQCAAFLERCSSGDLRAVTGGHVVAEVLHRLMLAEAKAKRPPVERGPDRRDGSGGRGRAGDVGVSGTGAGIDYLEANPDSVRRLMDYHAAGPAIEQIVKAVLPLTMEVIRASQWARSRDGLLVNDSLTAAMMRAEGMVDLASNDAAFLRAADLTVHRPTDI